MDQLEHTFSNYHDFLAHTQQQQQIDSEYKNQLDTSIKSENFSEIFIFLDTKCDIQEKIEDKVQIEEEETHSYNELPYEVIQQIIYGKFNGNVGQLIHKFLVSPFLEYKEMQSKYKLHLLDFSRMIFKRYKKICKKMIKAWTSLRIQIQNELYSTIGSTSPIFNKNDWHQLNVKFKSDMMVSYSYDTIQKLYTIEIFNQIINNILEIFHLISGIKRSAYTLQTSFKNQSVQSNNGFILYFKTIINTIRKLAYSSWWHDRKVKHVPIFFHYAFEMFFKTHIQNHIEQSQIFADIKPFQPLEQLRQIIQSLVETKKFRVNATPDGNSFSFEQILETLQNSQNPDAPINYFQETHQVLQLLYIKLMSKDAKITQVLSIIIKLLILFLVSNGRIFKVKNFIDTMNLLNGKFQLRNRNKVCNKPSLETYFINDGNYLEIRNYYNSIIPNPEYYVYIFKTLNKPFLQYENQNLDKSELIQIKDQFLEKQRFLYKRESTLSNLLS